MEKLIDCKLGTSKGSYTDEKGIEHSYDVFSIVLKDFPISVRVKPADSTAKEILLGVLGK